MLQTSLLAESARSSARTADIMLLFADRRRARRRPRAGRDRRASSPASRSTSLLHDAVRLLRARLLPRRLRASACCQHGVLRARVVDPGAHHRRRRRVGRRSCSRSLGTVVGQDRLFDRHLLVIAGRRRAGATRSSSCPMLRVVRWAIPARDRRRPDGWCVDVRNDETPACGSASSASSSCRCSRRSSRASGTCRSGDARVPAEATANRDRECSSRRPAVASSTATAWCSSTTASRSSSPSTARSCAASSSDDERATTCSTVSRRSSRATPASPVDREFLEKRLDDVRFSPYTPVPVADDVPEDACRSTSPSTTTSSRVVDVDAGDRARLPARAHWRPTSSATSARSTQEELDARHDEPEDVPARRRDRQDRRRADLRGRPARHAGRRSARGRRRGQRPSASSTYTPPVPGNDVYLTIDIDVQALTEQALARGARPRRTTARNSDGTYNASPGRRGGRARPEQRRGHRHGVVPDLRPGRVRQRHHDSDRWDELNDPTQPLPADQPGHPGPVRAGLDVQARHRDRRAAHRRHHRRRRRQRRRASTTCPAAPAGVHVPRTRAARRTAA